MAFLLVLARLCSYTLEDFPTIIIAPSICNYGFDSAYTVSWSVSYCHVPNTHNTQLIVVLSLFYWTSSQVTTGQHHTIQTLKEKKQQGVEQLLFSLLLRLLCSVKVQILTEKVVCPRCFSWNSCWRLCLFLLRSTL